MAKMRQVGGPKSGRPIITGNTFGYTGDGNLSRTGGPKSTGMTATRVSPTMTPADKVVAKDTLTAAQRRRRTIRQSLGIRLDGTQSDKTIAMLRRKGGLPQKRKRSVTRYPAARGGGGGGG